MLASPALHAQQVKQDQQPAQAAAVQQRRCGLGPCAMASTCREALTGSLVVLAEVGAGGEKAAYAFRWGGKAMEYHWMRDGRGRIRRLASKELLSSRDKLTHPYVANLGCFLLV